VIRVAILVVFLLLIYFFYKKYRYQKDLNKEIALILIVLMGLILFYQYNNNKVQDKVTNLLIAFKEGKKLSCDENIVDKNSYDYESGTMVFISKKIVDIKYPILSCEVK